MNLASFVGEHVSSSSLNILFQIQLKRIQNQICIINTWAVI